MKFKKLVETKEIKNQKDLVDEMDLEVKDANEVAIEEHDDNVKVFKDALKQCSLVEGYNYTEDKNNYTVNIKNRAELAKLIESLKQNNIKHRISRSKVEGYKYDVNFKYELKEDVEKTEVKKITTPRGTFEVVDKTEDELRKDGYGYHHSGNGYKIFVKNNQAVAIKECNLKENTINQTTKKVSKQKGNNTPITDEEQKKEWEAEDENNWNESKNKKLKEMFEPISSFKEYTYIDKTNQGWEIKKAFRDKDDDRLHVVVYRPKRNDYAVGLGYSPDGGYWNQGWYDYVNIEDAISDLKNEYNVEPFDLESAKLKKNESLNESDEDYDKDWDLEEFDDDEVLMYQMPKDINLAYLKNEIKLNSANIEYVGKVTEQGNQPGDYVIKGTKKDLVKFLDDAFDYKMHPDYVYREDEFNTDLLENLEETKKSRKQPKWRYNGNAEKSAEFIANGTNLAGQPCCEDFEIEDEDEIIEQNVDDKEDAIIIQAIKRYDDEEVVFDEDTINQIVLDIIEELYPDVEAYSEDWDNLYSTYEEKVTNILGDSLFESKEDDKEEEIEEKEDEVFEDDIEEITLDDIDIDGFDDVDLDNVSIDDIVDEDEQALDILKDKLDIEIIEDEDSPILSIKEKDNNDKKAPELKVEVEQEEAEKIDNTFNKEAEKIEEPEEIEDNKEETNLPAVADNEDNVNFDEIEDAENVDAKDVVAGLKKISIVGSEDNKEKENKSEEEIVEIEEDDDDTSFLDKIA